MQIGKIACRVISAGSWFGDAGATLGVMPKPLWKKLINADEHNRIKLALNLLLIQSNDQNILIDTGIGDKLQPKLRKIFLPSDFTLVQELQKVGLKRTDIDFIILTHLHFDHSGGIISQIDNELQLTFPNAIHIIQKREWEIARNPDELNQASYDFSRDLQLLEDSGNYKLVDGNYQVSLGVTTELVKGHSEGMQIVRIESEGELAYYAGDIIPLELHKHLAVNSAFDICRKDTFMAKKKILCELKDRNGILFLNHDCQKKYLKF